MKDQQEESAAAQKRPKESLGKAAAFCTSAIFESTRESALIKGLKPLVPDQWEEEGVKDFWEAKEKNNQTLDVLAQLREQRAHPWPVRGSAAHHRARRARAARQAVRDAGRLRPVLRADCCLSRGRVRDHGGNLARGRRRVIESRPGRPKQFGHGDLRIGPGPRSSVSLQFASPFFRVVTQPMKVERDRRDGRDEPASRGPDSRHITRFARHVHEIVVVSHPSTIKELTAAQHRLAIVRPVMLVP